MTPEQSGNLKLRTMGHATLALYRGDASPLLLTDPWLIGSVYWRSWWLQNYPSEAELDWLAARALRLCDPRASRPFPHALDPPSRARGRSICFRR